MIVLVKYNLEGKNPIWDDANCDEIDNFNNNFPKTIYYEIGKKLYIQFDNTGILDCYLKPKIIIYNFISLTNNDKELWGCDGCVTQTKDIYDSSHTLFCYRPEDNILDGGYYNFYFKIEKFLEQKLDIPQYYYYLTNTKYFFIEFPNLDEKINLIDLSVRGNLYVKYNQFINENLDFKNVYYNLSLDGNNHGKFFGYDENDNDLEFIGNKYSSVNTNKYLRYELSEEEKKNNGVHIKLKIGIFHIIDGQKQ